MSLRSKSKWIKSSEIQKPSWKSIVLSWEAFRLLKMIVGFILVYIGAAIWYGIIEIKEKISR